MRWTGCGRGEGSVPIFPTQSGTRQHSRIAGKWGLTPFVLEAAVSS